MTHSPETLSNLFEGLEAVVQYYRKDGEQGWVTMAAFDSKAAAQMYADRCSSDDCPWMYEVVEVGSSDNE